MEGMESIEARNGNKLFNRFVMQIRNIMHRGLRHVHIEEQQQQLWLHDDCKKLCTEECTGLAVVGLAWLGTGALSLACKLQMQWKQQHRKNCDVTV